MRQKYDLTIDTKIHNGVVLYRIKANVSFGAVKTGDLGGYVQSEYNLSHEGNAWVYDNAMVYDDARVYGNAKVYGSAKVYGNAKVYDDAWVYGNAQVYDKAEVYGDAQVCGDAKVYGDAKVDGNAIVNGEAWVHGSARVYGDAIVYCDAQISGDADYLCFRGLGSRHRTTTFFKCRDGNICVKCGCFSGTLSEFAEQVKRTHGGSKYAKEYLACINVVKIHFEKE